MPKLTILGREPAALIGFIEALLALAGTQLFGWSNEQVGTVVAVTAAILGLYTAVVTHDTLLGVAVGLLKAVVIAAIGFGAHISAEQTGLLVAVTTTAISLFQRTQTSPIGFEGATAVVSAPPAGPAADVAAGGSSDAGM